VSWTLLLALVPNALAAQPDTDLRLALRGVAESWAEPAVAAIYKGGAFSSGIAVVAPIHKSFFADIEFTYRKVADAQDRQQFEILPTTALVGIHMPGPDNVDGYLGLGPSFVTWRETYPVRRGTEVMTGTKFAAEARAGVRFALDIIQPTMSGTGSPFESFELDLFGARRVQAPLGKGLDLSAWRVGLGLTVVL
jgi:hypothetical protein